MDDLTTAVDEPQAEPTKAQNMPPLSRATGQRPISRDLYDGAELLPFQGRPGAMDAYALPSRGGR